MGCVYVIGNRELSQYKIGRTTDLKKRKLALDTHCPFPLEIIHQWPFSYKDAEGRLELHLHDELTKAGQHLRGEWFTMSEDDLKRIDFVAKDFQKLVEQEGFTQKIEEEDTNEKSVSTMDEQAVVGRLLVRQTQLEEELAEVKILLAAMTKPKRPGRSPEDMAKMREKKSDS